MKPESADYLTKAQQCLTNAQTVAGVGLAPVAAREAYLAVFHAAQAYVFEQTGRAAKTHGGVRNQFARLAKSEPRIDRELSKFLTTAYEYKSISDYSISGGSARLPPPSRLRPSRRRGASWTP